MVDAAGTIYIADSGNRVVRAITGTTIRTVAGTGASQFQSESGSSLGMNIDPVGLSVDRDGSLYITDLSNDRIRKMVPAKPALLSISFGDGQSGPPGNTVPVTVKITEASGIPVAGATVNFSVDAGTATLSAPSAQTDSNGSASIQVTFGATQGPVKVSAISAGVKGVTFNLTVLPPAAPVPTIGTGGLAGAGLSVPAVQALSSNGIASLFGKNFGAGATYQKVGPGDLVNGKVPTNFAGICVDVSGTRAPVFGASDTQVNFQAPRLNPGVTVTVKVISACDSANQTTSNGVTAPAQEATPEFFYFIANADGKNPVAATDSLSGAYLAGASLFPGSGFAPAKPGEYVTVYATGFGLTNPAFAAGEFFAGLAPAAGAVRVLLEWSVPAGGERTLRGCNAFQPRAISTESASARRYSRWRPDSGHRSGGDSESPGSVPDSKALVEQPVSAGCWFLRHINGKRNLRHPQYCPTLHNGIASGTRREAAFFRATAKPLPL